MVWAQEHISPGVQLDVSKATSRSHTRVYYVRSKAPWPALLLTPPRDTRPTFKPDAFEVAASVSLAHVNVSRHAYWDGVQGSIQSIPDHHPYGESKTIARHLVAVILHD